MRAEGRGAGPIRKARRTGRFAIPPGDAYIALLTAPERP